MDTLDADDVIEEANTERERRSENARDAMRWFLDGDRVGELIPREEAVSAVADHLGCDEDEANVAVGSLVSDRVDPVQQVQSGGERYVGAIEYNVFEAAGAYGYVHYDDRRGRVRRVICARCVEEESLDEHISMAEQGTGSASEDASWDELKNLVTSHYASEHTTPPEDVEPGGALVSGTTIGGNTAFHAGNDGPGSTLDADTVDGAQGDDLGSSQIDRDEYGNAYIATSNLVTGQRSYSLSRVRGTANTFTYGGVDFQRTTGTASGTYFTPSPSLNAYVRGGEAYSSFTLGLNATIQTANGATATSSTSPQVGANSSPTISVTFTVTQAASYAAGPINFSASWSGGSFNDALLDVNGEAQEAPNASFSTKLTANGTYSPVFLKRALSVGNYVAGNVAGSINGSPFREGQLRSSISTGDTINFSGNLTGLLQSGTLTYEAGFKEGSYI